MSTPEGLVVNACLDYLAARRIYAWRNNTGAVSIPSAHGRDRFIRYGKPGSSDILGIMPDGRFLAVECKTKTGRLTDLQQGFLAEVEARGGVAIVARRVEDVEAGLHAAMAARRSAS